LHFLQRLGPTLGVGEHLVGRTDQRETRLHLSLTDPARRGQPFIDGCDGGGQVTHVHQRFAEGWIKRKPHGAIFGQQ
jgi:hypothetical protein